VKRFGVLLGKHAARVVGEQHIAPPVAVNVRESQRTDFDRQLRGYEIATTVILYPKRSTHFKS